MPKAIVTGNIDHPLSALSFEGSDVRVVSIDGEPAFVGKDVCDRLGYGNPTKAMNDHCRGITKRYPLATNGGIQEVRVLSEADVLRLIVRSKRPEAERFERWVFEEVLPTIRKTGSYNVAPRPRRPSVLRAFNTAMKIGERIGLESGQLAFHAAQYCKAKCGENPLELMGVKSLAAPRDEHTLTPRQIGQELGDISAQRVNQELLKLGFQSFTIDGKGHRVYHLTDAGKPFGRLEDTARAHTQGGVTVLRWYPQIIDILGSQLRPVPQLERGAHQEAAHATM